LNTQEKTTMPTAAKVVGDVLHIEVDSTSTAGEVADAISRVADARLLPAGEVLKVATQSVMAVLVLCQLVSDEYEAFAIRDNDGKWRVAITWEGRDHPLDSVP
jgi:hypothetical protein